MGLGKRLRNRLLWFVFLGKNAALLIGGKTLITATLPAIKNSVYAIATDCSG